MSLVLAGTLQGHDPSVVLTDGRRLWAIALERLSRIKHHLPHAAELAADWRTCSVHGRNTTEDTDLLARATRYVLDSAGRDMAEVTTLAGCFTHQRHLDALATHGLSCADRSRLVGRLPHHEAHAASAFYPSGFEEAAVLVVDAFGDPDPDDPSMVETVSLWHAGPDGLRRLETHYSPTWQFLDSPRRNERFHASPGAFYVDLTLACGFGLMEAGKTMGLAPYGDPALEDALLRFVTIEPGTARARFDRAYHTAMEELTAPGGLAARANCARAGQRVLEEVLFAYVEELRRRTGLPSLAMAGGVALNSVANGALLRNGPFESIFVQPAAADDGIALGQALHALSPPAGRFSMGNVGPGRSWSESAIAEAVEATGRPSTHIPELDALCEAVAARLARGQIVGWFQGGSELGPRALGNRSILCDPRDPTMKDRLNAKVKFRESFRPFAPAVLEARADRHFQVDRALPHMLFVVPVTDPNLPAVTHVDGTARVQTVDATTHPRFAELLSAFEANTGVPVLLNTSLNTRGAPIVDTPSEALDVLAETELDALVLGNTLVC